MDQLRAMGHEITHDWVAAIRAAGGEANPRDAAHLQRLAWSDEDIAGIETAELVWVLMPSRPSFGCGVEFGYALSLGGDVIVSGDWRASVFTSQASERFDTHDEVFDWIGTH